MKKDKEGNKGWTCPKCGRTLSPALITCPFCSDDKKKEETNEGMKFEGKTILIEGSK